MQAFKTTVQLKDEISQIKNNLKQNEKVRSRYFEHG